MPFSALNLARAIAVAVGVASSSFALAGDPFKFELNAANDPWPYEPAPETEPLDSYFNQATTHNGQQLAAVLKPAVQGALQADDLTWEAIEGLQKAGDTLSQQPGGLSAAFEQLAGSQNANLAGATQNATAHISNSLLSTLRTLPNDDEGNIWIQGLGNGGKLDKQGGSNGLKQGTKGLMLGADWAVGEAWRVGVMGAKSTSELQAQRFKGELDSLHLGGYAVRQDGPLALRLGAIYSDHAGKNKRDVNLLGYKEQLQGKYDAQSQTVFSELGYQLGSADVHVEPFAGLGYQRYHRESFKEAGGLTALNVGSQTQQNLSSTFGLRLATVYRFDNRMSLTPHLSTHWKHLYGEVDSQVRQSSRAAQGNIDSFTINGTSLDRNSLDMQAGLDLALSTEHSVGMTYSAQAGTHSRSQGLTGEWKMSF
ncbi:autotransporter outer membrane beta-barrel domain-containing protein [Pseudomonas fluorescens]|uniref:autotransporter outer membrane beta-barrel domain-containing protein n=1 Tax=Pseudomonas fluorescens TaxID=294 RepID=UPI00190674AE|nr:autotransporter outer membrane beta-barrel domain-containing protein [Pseudomonas fluorescens]MBD8090594.1 autotransporter outer membrane beta-barrel domain-containing protein [Pseudomonas fluorescens]MBD8716714.1 autotransporter outer membrane beta-barrel domain-containing protein [Pseudomonas fluorescens]